MMMCVCACDGERERERVNERKREFISATESSQFTPTRKMPNDDDYKCGELYASLSLPPLSRSLSVYLYVNVTKTKTYTVNLNQISNKWYKGNASAILCKCVLVTILLQNTYCNQLDKVHSQNK